MIGVVDTGVTETEAINAQKSEKEGIQKSAYKVVACVPGGGGQWCGNCDNSMIIINTKII